MKKYLSQHAINLYQGKYHVDWLRYYKYRRQWDNPNLEREFPLQIDLDLQDTCNLDCRHCHQGSRIRSGEIMSLDLLKSIIKESRNNHLCSINFGATSEPLLQPMLLIRALDILGDKVMDIFIHTNGILLTNTVTNILLDTFLTHLCISIDAFTPETYNKMRSHRVYLYAIQKNVPSIIKKRKGHFPLVRVSFCSTPDNYQEADAFMEYWKDKVDIVDIQTYHKVNDTPIPDNFEQVEFSCNEPFKRMMIWPDGLATLCCRYRSEDVQIGDVTKHTIKEIWNGDRMNLIRKAFINNYGIPQTCEICHHSTYKVKDTK